ncbi:hypothetical protein Nmel_003731 [Mimus melanotis]
MCPGAGDTGPALGQPLEPQLEPTCSVVHLEH